MGLVVVREIGGYKSGIRSTRRLPLQMLLSTEVGSSSVIVEQVAVCEVDDLMVSLTGVTAMRRNTLNTRSMAGIDFIKR